MHHTSTWQHITSERLRHAILTSIATPANPIRQGTTPVEPDFPREGVSFVDCNLGSVVTVTSPLLKWSLTIYTRQSRTVIRRPAIFV